MRSVEDRLLILVAVWCPDDGANSLAWLSWYRRILSETFAADDKLIVFNADCHPVAVEVMADVPGVVFQGSVPQALRMDSDASSFQVALRAAKLDRDRSRDVLFLHTKGLSRDYREYEPWRAHMAGSTFDRAARVADLGGGERAS